MKKIFQYTLFLVMFIYSLQAYSQGLAGIKGVVRDSATGETIPFAAVRILDNSLGTNANSNGLFIIKGIPPGITMIQISAVGYKKTIKNIILNDDDFISVPVYLAAEPVELTGVISETDRIQTTNLANISIQSIDQRTIKSVPIAIENDVMKTLKILPGVNVGSDVTGQIYIRGGASDQNLVYCDNLKISNPFHAMGLFGIFNSDIVKSSDVITGGFDPEYGGKLSSVIKINTRDGNRNEHKLKLNAGLLAGSVSAEGPLFGGSYLFSYRRSYLDNMIHKILNNDVSLTFDDYFGKYSIDIGGEGRLAISVIGSGDDVDRMNVVDPSYEWRNLSLGATIESFVSNILVSWTASYSQYDMGQNYLDSDYGSNANSTYSSLSFDGKLDYQFTRNDIFSIGINVDMISIENDFVNSYGYAMKSSDNAPVLSFFMKYQLACIKNFIFDAGFRQNRIGFENQTLNLFEPRFNLRYNFTDDLAIKASFTRMHQYIISNVNEDEFIPLYEAWLPLRNPVTGIQQINETSLYPERAEQYVLGFDTRLFGKYKFVIQGYYKDIKDFIGYNMYRETDSDPEFVTGNGTSKGLEMFFKFDYKNFYSWVTYNLGWVEKENNGVKYSPRYDKRHNLSIVAGYLLPYEIKMGASWDFSTGTPFTPLTTRFYQPNPDNISNDPALAKNDFFALFGTKNSKRLPSYHKLDLSFTKDFKFWKFPKTEVSLNVTNLYDRKNIFYYNLRSGDRVNQLRFLVTGAINIEVF